ncbi:beta-eliminating lyase-related protein [Novosphingobium sp. ZN18A2]|uniref:threonine aldolase family protein n=1 Tax=Novosphingobium sp. ZN18A2 TaxID=3079861 RepID=UPI0030D453A6
MSESDFDLKLRCNHVLSGHPPAATADVLRAMAQSPHALAEPDMYGAGGAVAALEARVAALLGKPAAAFFVKGMTAQLASLRTHAEVAGVSNIAIHPQGHMDVDEAGSIERVGGIAPVRLGRYRPFTVDDLVACRDRLAAVVVELPLRRSGYLLPPLGALRDISGWCRENGVPLHFDGARLWEAAAGYGVDLAELAALADTVYVSFYKGLGGIGGAVLAGGEEHVAALAPWKTRFAGNVFTSFPQAITALDGMDRHLPKMPAYVARARSLASALNGRIQAVVHPSAPMTNAFQIHMAGTPADLKARNRAFAEQHGVWLFNVFTQSPFDGQSIGEVVIGEAAESFNDETATGWLAAFCRCGRKAL